MSKIIPDEGIDVILAILTGNQAAPSSLWLGTFKSQTGTTVPAANAVLSTQTGVTESAYAGYAREQVNPAEWAAAAARSPSGRKRTASQQSLPTAASGATQEVSNGYFLSLTSTGGVALCYVNFDEGAATIGEGDTNRVTPTLGFPN
jgi:hypothetical protein